MSDKIKDIFEIIADKKYPIKYDDCIEIAKKELRENSKIKLKQDIDIKEYDTIFVGYPNWWGTVPMPVWTFLEGKDFTDKKILPFKKCRAIGICKPGLLGQWEKNTDVKVGEYPALLDISTIKCKYGGTVSIDDAGQKEIGIAEDKKTEFKESVRDADCVYKLLVDVCRDVNNNFMQTSLKKSCAVSL